MESLTLLNKEFKKNKLKKNEKYEKNSMKSTKTQRSKLN